MFGVVLGDEDCWVDEHGHFGLAMHPNREPIGTPSGRYDYFFSKRVLCANCGAEFHAVLKEAIERVFGPGFTMQHVNPAPPTWKEWLAILVEFKEMQDPFDPNHHVSYMDERCPRCGGKLFTSDELLTRVKGREHIRSFNYPPVSESDDVPTCPMCKASPLEYKSSFIY
ncbi:MAG: hypothetical protein Q6373_008590 [Candidatus Sigynarchaeota archaeon]